MSSRPISFVLSGKTGPPLVPLSRNEAIPGIDGLLISYLLSERLLQD